MSVGVARSLGHEMKSTVAFWSLLFGGLALGFIGIFFLSESSDISSSEDWARAAGVLGNGCVILAVVAFIMGLVINRVAGEPRD